MHVYTTYQIVARKNTKQYKNEHQYSNWRTSFVALVVQSPNMPVDSIDYLFYYYHYYCYDFCFLFLIFRCCCCSFIKSHSKYENGNIVCVYFFLFFLFFLYLFPNYYNHVLYENSLGTTLEFQHCRHLFTSCWFLLHVRALSLSLCLSYASIKIY